MKSLDDLYLSWHFPQTCIHAEDKRQRRCIYWLYYEQTPLSAKAEGFIKPWQKVFALEGSPSVTNLISPPSSHVVWMEFPVIHHVHVLDIVCCFNTPHGIANHAVVCYTLTRHRIRISVNGRAWLTTSLYYVFTEYPVYTSGSSVEFNSS